MFYLVALLRTVAWDTASQIVLRNCSQEVRELGYVGGFAEGKKKDYCLSQKTDISS